MTNSLLYNHEKKLLLLRSLPSLEKEDKGSNAVLRSTNCSLETKLAVMEAQSIKKQNNNNAENLPTIRLRKIMLVKLLSSGSIFKIVRCIGQTQPGIKH